MALWYAASQHPGSFAVWLAFDYETHVYLFRGYMWVLMLIFEIGIAYISGNTDFLLFEKKEG